MLIKILSTIAFVLFLFGCAAPLEGNGRYFHLYKNGSLLFEFDGITNAGCRSFSNEMVNQFSPESPKVKNAMSMICTSEKAPRDLLPVMYIHKAGGVQRTLTMFMYSMEVCQKTAKEEMAKDSSIQISCEERP